MGDGNILNGATEELIEMKNSLQELEEFKSKSVALKNEEGKLEKEIESTEKAMNNEISTTIAKRRSEVETSFNGQINAIQAKLKKERTKRDKEKSSKVSERISYETEDIRKEILARKQDIKQVFDRNSIPKIFNNDFFFSVFMPSGVKEVLIMAGTFLGAILIPFIITLLIPEESRTLLVKGLVFFGCIGLFMGLYALIFVKIRNQHKDALKSVASYRSRIAGNKRRIKKIEKEVRNDSDESGYNLGDFDDRINEMQKQLDGITEDKKAALADFENHKKGEITEDIKERYFEKLDNAKKRYEKAYNDKGEVDKLISEATARISKKYEAYVGKEALNVVTVDSLIDLIETGRAKNVAEALEKYRNNESND